MKKIFLLSIILLTAFAAMSQTSRNGNDNLQLRNQQASSVYLADDFIENISVYPNPVIDMLKVAFKSSRKSLAVISIFNNIGKQVFSQEYPVEQGNNIISVDFRSKLIEPGIYFVQCVAEKEIFTRKLIVK